MAEFQPNDQQNAAPPQAPAQAAPQPPHANLILIKVISSPISDSSSIPPPVLANPPNVEAMAITRSNAKLKSPLNWSA